MHRLLPLAFLAATPVLSQTLSTPETFRLVTPQGPGSITIHTAGGWVPEQFVLYDKGTRAVFLFKNDALRLNVSYILSNDKTFDYNKESCINNVLGPLMEGPLRQATIKNKVSTTRKLASGQVIDIGSYLIAKTEGVSLNQQNVFGFASHNHTCAEIHLSRTPFAPGEEHVFDSTLDSFSVDFAYTPTAADYALMAKLLPPGMAALYPGAPLTHVSNAKVVGEPSQSLSFALPNHAGYLHMDAPNFVITEQSAKPNGKEFGIRARDKTLSGAEALGFLFVMDPLQPGAVGCRDWMLRSEKGAGVTDRKILKTYELASASGVPLALVDYEQSKAPPSARFARRFFAASGDLCEDVAITGENATVVAVADTLFHTLTFDPGRTPDFTARYRYATVLYDHHQFAAAAPVYESALSLASTSHDATKWRRLTTDQASMAYGLAGDLKRSAAMNRAAILSDPDYPFYYYNLACADAEAGDAEHAQTHLKQAFDRRANTLLGEKLPDPTKDDSILKLKSNRQFWAFVQSLPKP